MTSRTLKTLAILAVTSLIAACGGGGGGGGGNNSNVPEPPAPDVSAAGIWNGVNSNDAEIGILVLDTGEYFAIYGASGNSSVIAGLIQGNGASSGSQFTSSNGRDFNFQGAGVTAGKIDASVVFQTTLNGAVTADTTPSERVTFTSEFDPLYNQAPSLAAVAGSYDGEFNSEAGAEFARLVIGNAGEITATASSGCSATGTIKPHSSGNAYDVTITFGSSVSCALPNQTVSGAGVFQPETDEFYAQLTVALVNSDRTYGGVFTGYP